MSQVTLPVTTKQPLLKSKPGRPASALLRQSILDSAYSILIEEGLGRLTIERVAAQAGVGKPTIYRYWSNALELAMAAFISQPEEQVKPRRARAAHALGSARETWTMHVAALIDALATTRGRQITLTLASSDPESEIAKAFRHQVILKSRETGRSILLKAIEQGEVQANAELETVLDMVYGPLFFRMLVGHQKLSREFAKHLVNTAFDGVALGD